MRKCLYKQCFLVFYFRHLYFSSSSEESSKADIDEMSLSGGSLGHIFIVSGTGGHITLPITQGKIYDVGFLKRKYLTGANHYSIFYFVVQVDAISTGNWNTKSIIIPNQRSVLTSYFLLTHKKLCTNRTATVLIFLAAKTTLPLIDIQRPGILEY